MKKVLTIMGVASLCGTFAFADLPKASGPGNLVLPKKMARISPDLKIVGPWIDYNQGGISQPPCGTELIYDCFEPDPADNSPGCRPEYNLSCAGDLNECVGYRWFFGPSYCNMFVADDMLAMKPGSEGELSQHIELAWNWNPSLGGNPSESCLLILFTAEDAASTCVLPAVDNIYDGVIYNFGDLPTGNGYWYSDIDTLCDAGLGHQMPADGEGGTLFIQAQADTGTAFILATCSQPMLWGTKSPLDLNPGDAPYTQGPLHWDDDNAPFGEHGLDECFSYAGAVNCPDPLSSMICFYGGESDPCSGFICGDANCDGAFDGGDIDPFFLALGDPAGWQTMFPNCNFFCANDINGDQGVDGADIDAFFAALGGQGDCLSGGG